MEDDELIQSFRLEAKVYYLTKKGRDWIGSEKEVTKTLQVKHYLMRNDMYIFLGYPENFKVEFEYRFKGTINNDEILIKKEMMLRSDGYYIKGNTPHFLEVDNTQSMKENRKKIELYKHLTTYLSSVNVTPIIVFYTSSDVRQKKLQDYCKELGVKAEIYTRKDIRL